LEQLFGLDGRVALVTGANSGIGRGIAEALAAAGARLVLVARREEALREVASAIGDAAWIAADLGDRAEVARVAQTAAQPYGEPDILVNAAGVNIRPPLSSLTVEEWDTTMAVNLDAPFLLGQRFGPAMAARGWGRIVNI